MSTITQKATVTQVPFGGIEIEGLLLENGEFAISTPQVNSLISFSTHNNYASQTLKRLLGNDFSPHKAKVEGLKQLINCISLLDFERILAKLDRLGNKQAQELRDSLVGLSLTQLFSDAFGIKFDIEERQKYLIARQESKDLFFELATEISNWYEETKADRSQPKERYFSNSFDSINLGLFGKRSKQMKSEIGIDSGALVRDYFNNEALRRITQVQSIAAASMRKGKVTKPSEAVQFALECSCFDKMEFKKE
jgi:hypothetical protein